MKYNTWEPFVKKAVPNVLSQKDKERYHIDQRKTGKALVKLLPTKETFLKKEKETANPIPESRKDSGIGLQIKTPEEMLKSAEDQKRRLAEYLINQGKEIPDILRDYA